MLVSGVIQRIHERIGICDTGPWLRDGGHGTTSMRGFEHCRARAVGSDRGRPQPAAQTCGAGGHRACLGGSALGAAGGTTHWRQSADGVAVATTLRRERDRGFVARQDPQTRQGADRSGNHGADGGIDLHRAAASGDPLDRPGNGPKPSASRWVRCNASGALTNCSRTGCAPSSAPAIPALPPSSRTSSGSISIRRLMQWCCRLTKRARSKHSTAPSRDFRSTPGAAKP